MNPQIRRFQRRPEAFTCLHCGQAMANAGYANHCSRCLWSRHVDVNPGDRSAACQGMMEPVGLDVQGRGKTVIIHRCQACGAVKKNRSAPDDNPELLIRLSARPWP